MSSAKLINLVFVGAFLLLISLPGLAMVGGFGPFVKIEEKRAKAVLPNFSKLDYKKSVEGFEKFFNDNFGFRNELILFNRALRYFALGTSADERVLLGKDGWLFFKVHGNLIETRNLEPFTPLQLKKWGNALQARSNYAKKNGSAFLLVIAPNPKTIFPEILPDWVPPPEKESRMDQLYQYLAANTDVQFLDLRPVLAEHKNEQIYFKTDTHWNTLGAYYAYRAIIAKIAELLPRFAGEFKPVEMSNFEIKQVTSSGNLTTIMGLPGMITEQTVELQPKRIWQSNNTPGPIKEHNFTTVNPHRPAAPRLLIFRDSYAWAIQALLAEHFSFVRFRWLYGFQRKLVKKDKPDLVIQFFVESVLAGEVPRSFTGG